MRRPNWPRVLNLLVLVFVMAVVTFILVTVVAALIIFVGARLFGPQ